MQQQKRTRYYSSEYSDDPVRDKKRLLDLELEKILATCDEANSQQIVQQEFNGFRRLYSRFLSDPVSTIQWDKIQQLPSGAIQEYGALSSPPTERIKSMLDKLVVIKLNGGLGTSMGCKGPKSIIQVRNDKTFLDLTVDQIQSLNIKYKARVPLILMNSFNTDDDTKRIIHKYNNVEISTFNQSRFPRINKETLLPIARHCETAKDPEAWYPPGHGDFFEAFHASGLLDDLIRQGKEYCFVSNIDNLGATVDLNILNFLLQGSSVEFLMEVTDKTRADVKGGTLIQYENKLHLLELAQVPKDHVEDFKSIKTFKYFNTNNLWMKLSSIKEAVENGTLDMEIIVNPKTLGNGVNVIQLETAVGAAMKSFGSSVGLCVPRSRFLPVKKTSDLLLVMSNLYNLQNGSLAMSPLRPFSSPPIIKLGDNHFAKVQEFLHRFASTPDLLDLDHLTVLGDVTFGKGVSLKGTVIIVANHGDRIDIPSGACLENKIVSGNLRIVDH